MAQITQLKTWTEEILYPTDLNAEVQQIINTINALGNANWAAAGVDNLSGTKVDVSANATFRAEHSVAGGHDAFADNNVDRLYVKRNASNPDTHIDIVFHRVTVYSSDTITTRTRKLVQAATATTLTANIGVQGANGRETGSSVGASETWYIWVIYNPSGTAAAFLSLDYTIAALTLPSGYTYAKLVGKAALDADGDFENPIPLIGAGFGNDYAPRFVQMAKGGYTGSGGHAVTGVGFPPDLALVIPHGATVYPYPVIKTDQISGTTSFILGSSTFGISNGITSLDADGFTVGANDYVDKVSDVYSWIAMKNSTGAV